MGRRELDPAGCRAISKSVLACALLVVLGCGGLVASPTTAAPEEAADLEHQIVALKRQLTVSQVEMDRLRQKVAELETALAEARTMTHRSASGPEPTVSDRDLDDQTLETWPSPVESSDIDVTELPEPEQAMVPPVEASPPVPTPQTFRPVDSSAQALYDEGYTLFHQNHYLEAEKRFLRFLELHSATNLADNALFWIGESRYARGDYHAALAAFSDTVEQYPQGNKVADALLKAGKCLEAVGDRERARETYAEVEQRFPESGAAAAARELLAKMR